MTKLAQGRLDLHSKRGEADLVALASVARAQGANDDIVERIAGANTVAEAFGIAAHLALGDAVAAAAWSVAARALQPASTELEIVVFDRAGTLVGRAPFAPIHG